MLRQLVWEYDFFAVNPLHKDEGGQGMLEYLLIVSMVVFTIVALFAALMHFGKMSDMRIYRQPILLGSPHQACRWELLAVGSLNMICPAFSPAVYC